MIEKLSNLVREAKNASSIIKSYSGIIRLVSHYDADGIASAAIMVKVLSRENKNFHLTLIKQLNEDLIEKLSGEKNDLIIFTDLGSGQLKEIGKHLSECRIIICDHHEPQGEELGNVIHMNSVSVGITGNISGSGVTYILARAINPENIDLSQLAIVGAIGDSQIGSVEEDWGLAGLNKEILKEAQNKGNVKVSKGLRLWGRYTRPVHKALEYSVDPYIPGVSGSESSAVQFLHDIGIKVKNEKGGWRTISDLSLDEQKRLASGIIAERIRGNHENPHHIFGDVFELLDKEGEFRDANEFATVLNACGKLGRGYLGVAVCLNDFSHVPKIKQSLEEYRREIRKSIDWVCEQIEKSESDVVKIQKGIYVIAGDKISEHTISNVISIISHSNMLPVDKPLFGFANAEDGIKISVRADDILVKKGLNLKEIVSEAAEECEGQGGGHPGASGATIPYGSEERFINAIEKILTNKYSNIFTSEVVENGREKGEDGEADSEGEGVDRGTKGEDGKGQDRGKTGEDRGKKDEMEGKGLVRYFGS
jgi:RecJ-like exonuclease